MSKYFVFVLIIGLALSCKTKNANTLFEEVNTNIQFTNSLVESEAFNVFKYRNFYNGGGVATGDLNNDGLPEVFFTANQTANKLYLNKGNFEFEDITQKAGITYDGEWSTGVVFVDINADGWLDIYVCNAGNMLQKAKRKN
ncbi:MAG: VCBS repeat-containing protein, partial [Sediminibacterium sp.]|nr:VCBS repeat-containing protein [Sediminibacterium sp.]